MTTKMNKNGVSTCKAGEKYEKFQMTIGRKRRTFYHIIEIVEKVKLILLYLSGIDELKMIAALFYTFTHVIIY